MSITVFTGPMRCGKTTEMLINVNKELIKNKKVLYYKFSLNINNPIEVDDVFCRNNIKINKSNNLQIKKIPTNYNIRNDILFSVCSKNYSIFIDEIQFYAGDISELCEELLQESGYGIDIFIAGLDMDWKCNVFPQTCHMMGIADTVKKLSAIDHFDKSPAKYTLKVSGSDNILESGESKYINVNYKNYKELFNDFLENN